MKNIFKTKGLNIINLKVKSKSNDNNKITLVDIFDREFELRVSNIIVINNMDEHCYTVNRTILNSFLRLYGVAKFHLVNFEVKNNILIEKNESEKNYIENKWDICKKYNNKSRLAGIKSKFHLLNNKIIFVAGDDPNIIVPDVIERFVSNGNNLKSLTSVLYRADCDIPYRAFSETKVNKVIIKGQVRSIEQEAFKYCGALEEIEVPDSLDGIKKGSFYHCKKLKNIKLYNNIKFIDEEAFYYCMELNELDLPDNVTYIGDRAFQGCTNLNRIKLPENLEIIGEAAFMGCINLETIVIPKKVKSIGRLAFDACQSLRKIYIEGNPKNFDQALHTTVGKVDVYIHKGCCEGVKWPSTIIINQR